MADRAIGELVAANAVQPSDLFVLEQSGTAKKLTGQTLENWLLSFADGHGGIQSLEKTSSEGLEDTYTFTFADETTASITIKNGRGIDNISPPVVSGLQRTYTVNYNDDTTSDIIVMDGAKGDPGDDATIYIKYSAVRPTSNADMGDIPDAWIGIYHGYEATAPVNFTDYTWYEMKGDKGDTGPGASLDALNTSVEYAQSSSGITPPAAGWSLSPVDPVQGMYNWTRTTITFAGESPIVSYGVSYSGIDGSGAVDSVNGQTGAVTLTGADILLTEEGTETVAQAVAIAKKPKALHIEALITSLPHTITNESITENMRVVESNFETPSAITSDVNWTTDEGSLVLSGTLNGSTTADLILIETN